MTLTAVQLAANYENEDGSIPQGIVVFTLTEAIEDTSTGAGVEAAPIQGVINASGQLKLANGSALTVVANDDATTSPVGSQYNVEEELNGVPLLEYQITVPHTAPGGICEYLSQRP